MEVKDGEKPPSAQKLTSAQVKWHGMWMGQVDIVRTDAEALAVIGIK
jgi:hypothetical protein